MKKLSVVIPCCNEEENVGRFQSELIDVIRAVVPLSEFIVVDDGSTDHTLSRLQALQANNPSLRLLTHPTNRGLGAAIQTALQAVEGDAVLTLDADLTFHPSQTSILVGHYNDAVDCVMGSPVLGTMEGVSFLRRLLSQGANLIYRILLGRAVSSASSIFRLYRASCLSEIQLRSQSFDINAEILLNLLRRGRRVVEVPVVLTRRKFGESKIKTLQEIRNHARLFKQIIVWRWLGWSPLRKS